jgi:hypothetical protein
MKKEIADQWVAALRSGKYAKGFHALRTINEKYCCLGVLCKVLDLPSQVREGYHSYADNSGSLAKEICDLVEIKSEWGRIDSLGCDLSALNDTYGLTFSQIADLIEYFWEEL